MMTIAEVNVGEAVINPLPYKCALNVKSYSPYVPVWIEIVASKVEGSHI